MAEVPASVPAAPAAKRRNMRWLIALVCVFAFLVARRWEPGNGLTALIQIDRSFDRAAGPRLQAIPHHVRDGTGFDGQYYAWLALDPLLLQPDTAAPIDAPSYRARRILLPAVAWLAGAGQPDAIVDVFPCLDLACWALLLGLLIRAFPPASAYERACVTAVLFSAGMIETVRLSLPDLPAALLMFLPGLLALRPATAIGSLALSCLSRETSALAVAGWFSRPGPDQATLGRRVLRAGAAVAPLAAWLLYVRSRWGAATFSGGNLGLPLVAAVRALGHQAANFAADASPGAFGGVAAIIGLHAQAAYLWLNRSWDNGYWRIGAAFSVLLFVLGGKVWELPLAACRDVLPMTIAFNLLLLREPRPRWQWFAVANASALFGVYKFLTYVS